MLIYNAGSQVSQVGYSPIRASHPPVRIKTGKGPGGRISVLPATAFLHAQLLGRTVDSGPGKALLLGLVEEVGGLGGAVGEAVWVAGRRGPASQKAGRVGSSLGAIATPSISTSHWGRHTGAASRMQGISETTVSR